MKTKSSFVSLNQIIHGDVEETLAGLKHSMSEAFHLTFLDPPFNQSKDYGVHDDRLPEKTYWSWMKSLCSKIHDLTAPGGVIFFMQREKNTEMVLRTLRETGWHFQNLIIWTKMTSAVPQRHRFGKQYQILAFASKGEKPRIFNRLRVDLPPAPHHKKPREEGVYVTDVWTDIRELTSGFFAGEEALRTSDGKRIHEQQSPIHLLFRIILATTLPGDLVLDPFAGTGTTGIVAKQLERVYFLIELNSSHVKVIKQRLNKVRPADDVTKYLHYYRFTPNLLEIIGESLVPKVRELLSKKSLEEYLRKQE